MKTFLSALPLPIVTFCLCVAFEGGAAQAAPKRSLSWDAQQQGGFVTALASDKQGRIYAATEDEGVSIYDAATGEWQQFLQSSGLGDNSVHALAIDQQGRLWAGTLNHGVSVWNGAAWKNYGVLDGPLGERVFDIGVCPIDGDVWIATDAGLARYRIKTASWSYYSRAQGLPSDQVQAVAFDKDGNIIVGTQCDGLAMASRKGDYAAWRIVAGPDEMPLEPSGEGLPSSLINDVLVARNGSIYVATTGGLAVSTDKGLTWAYGRGADWVDKVRGRLGGAPNKRWQPAEGATLSEDRVTCLAEDGAARLWLGHWRGYEAFDTATNERVLASGEEKDLKDADDMVTAILPLPDGPPLIARYGSGIVQSRKILAMMTSVMATAAADMSTHAAPPAFPSPAAPPTRDELEALTRKASLLPKPLPIGAALYEGDDWRTQGDWVGRYGHEYAMLCAMRAPLDHTIVNDHSYLVEGDIGPHAARDDGLRHWMHWERSDDARVLYDPILGYRREAEWDDHGEDYAQTHEGPDVWVFVSVPSGLHRLSLYFFNPNGHEGPMRMRDYLVEVKPDAPSPAEADLLEPLARARARDFWGGVYKRFVVKGPGAFWVKVGKNNSFNTILQSVMLDRLELTAHPTSKTMAWMGNVRYDAPRADGSDGKSVKAGIAATPVKFSPGARWTSWAAQGLWSAMDEARGKPGGVAMEWPGRLLALRAALGTRSRQSMLASWRWRMALWTPEDRAEFGAVMARAHQSLISLEPQMKNPH